MKKTLIATLLILSSTISLANARFFIGIDGGYSMDRVDVRVEPVKALDTVIKPGSFTANAYKGNGYVFNLNLGTQHYFNQSESIGFRWLFNINYGRSIVAAKRNKIIRHFSNIFDLTLGADMLFELVKFDGQNLAVFAGVAGGIFGISSDANRYTLESYGTAKKRVVFGVSPSIQARIGLSLFLAQHHRIEFIAKIPVYSVGFEDDETYTYKPIQFMLGYKFVF